ncbi:MAG: hypothetical protein RLZZ210_129 [Pseudomonadota bacterium]|jgi:protease-4
MSENQQNNDDIQNNNVNDDKINSNINKQELSDNSTSTNNDSDKTAKNSFDINLIQSSLASTIDNSVKTAIKEYRRFRLRKFIFQVIFFSLVVLIGFGLVASPEGGVPKAVNISSPHTAVISIDGEISSSTPANADTIIHSLRNAFKNQYSTAILLKINSPGGSPVQSGIVYDEIKRLRTLYPKKMLYAVAGDICASGAYYIASSADFIYADKASMVGSIGVLMDGFGFNRIIDKVGVDRRLYTAGKNKGMLDPFSPENPEHKVYIHEMLNGIHQQFITAVKNGRGARLKETPDTFSGLIWNGDNAVKNGLIDGLATADIVARDIIKQEEIVDYTVQEGLADRLAKQFGAAISSKIDIKLH